MSNEQDKSTENPESLGYQVGEHDIDKTPSLSNDGEIIEFQYEATAVFKRLAEDIYETPEAGIREPLQNALTAVKNAHQEGLLQEGNGIVEIEMHKRDTVQLVIEDNGIGISRDVLNEVLSVIGRSTNRDDGDVSGKYGMGFLACYKLVGSDDGGFIMYTNSRETEEPPLKGIWKPGVFETDVNDELPERFGSDRHGTRFEFTLKEGITANDVRDWIQKHAEWAQIPIVYREYDDNGRLDQDDEFGTKSLQTEHADTHTNLVIENDYFTAVCSPDATGKTLLINSPIERNSNYSSDKAYYNIDVRLKNESGIIYEGPNKGFMPVSDAEYESMDEDRRDQYIPKREVSPNDKQIPSPTGTRESLEPDTEFWSDLHSRFRSMYQSEIRSQLEDLQNPSDFHNLTVNEKKQLYSGVENLGLSRELVEECKSVINNTLDISVNESVARVLSSFTDKIRHVPRGTPASSAETKNGTEGVSVGTVLSSIEDGDVFMGVSMNDVKMDAAWEDNEQNQIVRVEGTNQYEKYSKLLGWKKLKNVTDDIEELDITQELYEKLTSNNTSTSTGSSSRNSGLPAEERLVVVHMGDKSRKMPASRIREKYNNNNEHLIMFPSTSEENLSDNRNLQCEHVHLATGIVKVTEYLTEAKNVTSIENWNIEEEIVKTSDGEMTAKSLKQTDKKVIFHSLQDDIVEKFQDEEIMHEFSSITRSAAKTYGANWTKTERHALSGDTIYVPITESKLDKLRAVFDGTADDVYTIVGETQQSISTSIDNHHTVYWYAWAKSPSLRSTTEIKALNQAGDGKLTENLATVIDALSDSQTADERTPKIESIAKSKQYLTSDGKLSAYEIGNTEKELLIHVLQPSDVHVFRQDGVPEDALEYIYENAALRRRRNDSMLDDNEIDDILYIPLTKGEKEILISLAEKYGTDHSIVSGSAYVTNGSYKIGQDIEPFAYSKLSQEVYDSVIGQKPPRLDDGGIEFIRTIAQATSDTDI